MAIQESGEMYLETIYVLSQKSKNVHAVDVGEAMGFSKPSVSRALGLLKNEGLVQTSENGSIVLTKEGEKHAKRIFERHTLLSELFVNLGVDKKNCCRRCVSYRTLYK